MAANEELEKFRQQWQQELQVQHPTTAASGSKPNKTRIGAEGSDSQKPGLTHTRHRRKSSATKHSEPPLSPTSPTKSPSHHHHQQPLDEDESISRLDREFKAADVAEIGHGLTALELYEQAVVHETEGRLGDSLNFYRKAFKMDQKVQDKYKEKHFPKSAKAAYAESSLSSTAHAPSKKSAHDKMPPPMPTYKPQDPKMKGKQVEQQDETPQLQQKPEEAIPGVPTTNELLQSFANERILPSEKMSPTKKCYISIIPKEILLHIMHDVALTDIGSYVRLARVCKATCWLVYSESSIWKEVCNRTWKTMCWGPKWRCDMRGNEIDEELEEQEEESDDSREEQPAASGQTVVQAEDGSLWLASQLAADMGELEISEGKDERDEELEAEPVVLPKEPSNEQEVAKYKNNWRTMFIERPRIRYNGIYIAVCNYLRPGHPVNNSLTLLNPYHWVTYYRYLRFYPNGFVMSLLTTTEPSEVVHILTLENWLHVRYHSDSTRGHRNAPLGQTLASSSSGPAPAHANILKAVLPGRWKFSFDPTNPDHTPLDGRVEIETEGAGGQWKYIYQMELWLKMRPKGGVGKKYSSARSDQLNWGKFYSYNRTSQDVAEFSLKNDKPFHFSRVKAYEREMGLNY